MFPHHQVGNNGEGSKNKKGWHLTPCDLKQSPLRGQTTVLPTKINLQKSNSTHSLPQSFPHIQIVKLTLILPSSYATGVEVVGSSNSKNCCVQEGGSSLIDFSLVALAISEATKEGLRGCRVGNLCVKLLMPHISSVICENDR